MIYFQTDNGQLDLTMLKIRFNEENNLVSNDSVKSYSSSFFMTIDEQFLQVLGLPSYDNNTSAYTVVKGQLYVDNITYEGYISLGEIEKKQVKLQLFYGEEVLDVYNTKMADLPWPTILTNGLADHAKNVIEKSYPDVSHNFPLIYRPDIGESDYYAAFLGFVNNYREGVFLENYTLGTKGSISKNASTIFIDNNEHLITVANTQATIITNITGATAGNSYIIEGGSDENSSVIEVGTLFDITEKFIAKQGAYIRLLYNGIRFVELMRGTDTPFFINQNVMSPYPYMLEMIRLGYAQEGKQLRGELVNTDIFKKVLYCPKQYMEQFSSSDFVDFRFDMPTSESFDGSEDLGIYTQVLSLDRIGGYKLKMKLNFDNVIARYFSLEVIETSADLTRSVFKFDVESRNRRVTISETLDITVTNDNLFSKLRVELKLPLNNSSMKNYTGFNFSYKDGRQNVFPDNYSLRDYMPDMTFGTFINTLKNWLNLDIEVVDDNVYLNFADTSIQTLITDDHTALEDPNVRKKFNNNRVFQLTYNDNSRVFFDQNGQVFETPGDEKELIKLDMNISVLRIENNRNAVTSVYDDTDGLRFCLYNGSLGKKNETVQNIDNMDISLQQILERNWKQWLYFRCNSKTFRDRYKSHFSERFDFRKSIFKYNEKLLLLKINKTRISDKYWQIEQEAESL